MAVRNWWINCQIDGRKTSLSGGPRTKEGGFDFTLYQRDDGEITSPLRVSGFANPDGTLTTYVYHGGFLIGEHTTTR